MMTFLINRTMNELTSETTKATMSSSTAAYSDPTGEMLQCNTSLQNSTTFGLFGLVKPSDMPNWEERTTVYWVLFYLMLVVFIVLFLLLGMVSILLIVKRHLAMRFKVRTFIAIDLALLTLGVSRALFLLLDPWGQSGFCTHYACVVISRLINALAFPSLTASYTLVFITLWMSARIQLGLSNVQRLKILVPLCFVHYAVAIIFEIIGNIPVSDPTPILILLLLCETVFSLWGFLVCFSFLFAGYRLLRSVERSARQSSVICRDSPNMTRHQLIEKSRFKNQAPEEIRQRSRSTMKLKHMLRDHHRRAIRKVTLITYITVVLGMLYSTVSIANLLLVTLSLFDGCPGYIVGEKQRPIVWLVLRYVFFSLEILLALLLTYAISDYQPVVTFVKKCITSVCGLRKVSEPPEASPSVPNLQNDSLPSSNDTFSPTRLNPGCSLLEQSPPPNLNPIYNEEKSDSSLELPEASPSPPPSPIQSNGVSKSPTAVAGGDVHVPIMDYNSSPISLLRNNTPKHPSPLTVSFSLNDEEALANSKPHT